MRTVPRLLRVIVLALALSGGCALPDVDASLRSGDRVRVGGHRVFCRTTGAGPDVVLLHGLGDSSVGWRNVESLLLQAGYRVTVGDALGAGRSAKPPGGDYSVEAHADRLLALLEQRGIRSATLVGHSLGGSVALTVARRAPDRVERLVLLAPAAYREGAVGGRWIWSIPVLPELLLSALPASFIVEFALAWTVERPSEVDPAIRALSARQGTRPGSRTALVAQQRQAIPPDDAAARWERGHRAVDVPTLVIWGAEDAIIDPAQGRRLAADLPRARRVVLAGVGHAPHLEAPGEVVGAILGFLRGRAP